MFTVDAKGKLIGGFDAIVGNPPFVGGTMISSTNGAIYKDFLYATFEGSGNRMDLVAYFFRRAFGLLSRIGTFGLIATNSIAQGDTRKGGLAWICHAGGHIYNAVRRLKWPGAASVVVSVVHVSKSLCPSWRFLDGRYVDLISAFLFHQGGDSDPDPLLSNRHIAFEGVKPYGQGFIFDDADTKASPLSLMEKILAQSPACAEVVLPYMSGDEINDSPVHSPSRYIINFRDLPIESCRPFDPLLKIVEDKVKPERESKSEEVRSRPWWQFFRSRAEMNAAIARLARILVVSRVGDKLSFTFLPSTIVPSEAIVVFALQTYAAFAVLQSRIHDIWARFLGSSMKDDLRYTPTDCFATFPLSPLFETNEALEEVGREYFAFRAALMVRNNEGLTKTYTRFHDPDERLPDVLQLRELHAAMDRAVLEAYGWHDLADKATCEFLLDYEDDDEDEEEAAGRRSRKKPWRYRWPDDFHDEVLARLLALNQKRAEEERLGGLVAVQATTGKGKETKGKIRKKRTNRAEDATLFDIRQAGGES